MKVLAPNTLLQNRYLVVHLIGKGGMGEVYLAVDQRLGSAVALKRTFFAEHESLGNAFEREARILGRLRHPVLPKVSDHFIENGNQYLVMEHISGDDLAKRLELTQKPFPLSWVLFWADQLMDALWYLHSHEPPIIHRDIKPQNLKLTDENNVILLDFGLSKSSIGDSRISQPINSNASGSITGYTPHYAPMEQIRGTGTSHRSDLYSLSATIYQLLTNTVPPDALTRADSLLNGSPDPIRPINEVNAEVNKTVSEVILKGMAVSQDLRYTNAREMQKELRDAYAQLQKAMAAHTVDYSAETGVPAAAPIKTEPLISVPPIAQTPFADLVTETEPPAMRTESLPTKTEQPDFDATLRYDGDPQVFPSKQSDVKTEVFSGAMSSTETTPQTPPAENFSPEASAPDVWFEEQNAAQVPQEQTDFTAKVEQTNETNLAATMYPMTGDYPAAENTAPPASSGFTKDFSASDDFSSVAPPYQSEQSNREGYDSQPQQAAAMTAAATPVAVQPQKKSGGGKIFAILGVLGLLLFLGIGAAGFGWWYFYVRGATTTQTDPTPTPTASATPTATPAEILVDNNTNTNVNADNSNTELTTTNTDTNAKTDPTKTEVKTTPTQQTTRITPTPQITRVTPTQQTTRVTPTPKITRVTPTPKKDDSTKILH